MYSYCSEVADSLSNESFSLSAVMEKAGIGNSDVAKSIFCWLANTCLTSCLGDGLNPEHDIERASEIGCPNINAIRKIAEKFSDDT